MADVGGTSLIPGLPYEIALNCLVRVPVSSHNDMIHVSKPWRNLLLNRDSEFYKQRSQLSLVQPMVFLHPAKFRERGLRFFKRESTMYPYKSLIFVMGGEECDKDGIRSTDFYIVDTLTRKINRGPDMLFPTSMSFSSAFGVLNDRLYVVGRLSYGDFLSKVYSPKLWTLAQCYDILSNTWRLISPLPFPTIIEYFFVRDGKFWVIGVSMDGSKDSFSLCYSDAADSWIVVDTFLRLRKWRETLEEFAQKQKQQEEKLHRNLNKY